MEITKEEWQFRELRAMMQIDESRHIFAPNQLAVERKIPLWLCDF